LSESALGEQRSGTSPRFCPACGEALAERPRFCPGCGTAVAPVATPPQRRKLATLLFCDMSGSTAMGERVDPESVREMMFSYFHEMRGAIERHGGTVEKFVGDAVMAIFGVPTAHEDDALRAVRAALEMQSRMSTLNAELEFRYGSRIALRIGVNTGEVVAGDAATRETMVTGDPVNVAARLEQTAGPDEVLIGEQTLRLVRESVSVEPVEPLALKGKSEPVPAYRLLAVAGGSAPPPRPRGTALICREAELELLLGSFAVARAENRCLLVTLLGEPGVGKSRLADEFLDRAADAVVLRGRCLSYGEGITFWPLAEAVRGAASIRDEDSRDEALDRLEALLADETDGTVVARRIAIAIGLAEGAAVPEEIGWAFRRLLETLASERPLVLLVDDVHWGEPLLIDLLAELPRLCRAPVLLLTNARPEFAAAHPDWPGNPVRLEPLTEAASDALLDELLGSAPELEALRVRVRAAAAGNPLFAQELVAMLVDEGVLARGDEGLELDRDASEIRVPPSIGALLGARLDLLDSEERSVLEAGAVEGQVFHRGAVAALLERASSLELATTSEALAARELVQTASAQFLGEAAYRFRHILVRDAAYNAIAKKQRVGLHERFARWLEEKTGARLGEYEEILGFHLEQAVRYRSELGPLDEAGKLLAADASVRLTASGRRALDRGDAPAAANLFERALWLARGTENEEELRRLYAAALVKLGELERADALLAQVVEAATARGDARLRFHALIEQELIRLQTAPEGRAEDIRLAVARALPVFEEHGDELGVARGYRLLSEIDFSRCRFGDCAAALELALVHAERSGDERERAEILAWLGTCLCWGPTPVREASRRCQEMLALPLCSDFRWFESALQGMLGFLAAMHGDFEQARALTGRSRSVLEELGLTLAIANRAPAHATIELWAGDLDASERVLREALALFESMGERAVHGSVATYLADVLARGGRDDEARALVEAAARWAPSDDVFTQIVRQTAAARLEARAGQAARALELARDAVDLAATTDSLTVHGSALLDLAETLLALDRPEDVPALLDDAAFLLERKDHFVLTARAQALRFEFG
jgi:class 3 adenylate cyclase/tetratricopeptide (TPR) repeat protein